MPSRSRSQVGATPVPDASPGLVALHRCNTVDWKPSPVVAIEACPDGTVVAVAREDGAIELWDTEFWHCSSVIPGKQNATISALVWTYDAVVEKWRLFSFGLDTNVVEWDLRHLQPRCVTSSMGGAVWDAAAQPSSSGSSSRQTLEEDAAVLVAIATDDGAVRLLVAEPSTEGLQFKRSFARAECRALSIAWSPDGSVVYAGYSDGCIRAHAIETGQEVLRITAAPVRAAGGDECIWALAVLPDGALLSGSSRGVTQIWEPQFGTLVSSFQQHQSDVLCVAAAPDASRVFAAGVDPTIAMYERQKGTPDNDLGRFQLSERKRPHTHDVRAMAITTTPSGAAFLITGGNDAQLLVHSVDQFERRHPVRICRSPQAPSLCIAAGLQPPLLLACSRTCLDLWRFPRCSADGQAAMVGEEGDPVPLQTAAAHLARVIVPGATSCTAVALAPNGAWLAASTPWRTYLIVADSNGAAEESESGKSDAAAPDVGLMPLPDGVPAGLALCFASDSAQLFVGGGDGRITSVDIGQDCADEDRVSVLHQFDSGSLAPGTPGSKPSAGTQARRAFDELQASPCGKWLLALTSAGAHLLDLESGAHHGRLPIAAADGPVTAASFSADGTSVAIATTEVKLAIYDCVKLAPATWLRQRADVALKLDAIPGFVQGISFRPGADGELLLHSHGATCHVNLTGLRQGGSAQGENRKKRHRGKGPPVFVGDARGSLVRVMLQKDVCLGASFVSATSLVLVEADWQKVLKELPAPMALRLYGQ